MSHKDNDQRPREDTGDTTSRFRADVLDALDASASDAAVGVGEVEGLPSGSAVVVCPVIN